MSTDFRELFKKHINSVVNKDPRNTPSNRLLGYDFEYVRDRILLKGRADFNMAYIDHDGGAFVKYHRLEEEGYGPPLSPNDIVLLYCYINLKSHFAEVSTILGKQQATIEPLFSPDCKTLVIDFGCGPGTVCLALAERFKDKNFEYTGIDIAPAMQQKANELFIVAQEEQLISKDCTAKFISSWDEFNNEVIPSKSKVLLSFSYFFASNTLKESSLISLAAFVKTLRESEKIKEIKLLYINSISIYAHKNYNKFVELINIKSKPEELGNFVYEIIPL